jgi:hypothetical protein
VEYRLMGHLQSLLALVREMPRPGYPRWRIWLRDDIWEAAYTELEMNAGPVPSGPPAFDPYVFTVRGVPVYPRRIKGIIP